METLIEKSRRVTGNVLTGFNRYLFTAIDWNDRLIILKGARGVGKTTLLLQHIKFNFSGNQDEVLYVSLDDLYFLKHELTELVKEFVLHGGKYLFLDEVHKYKNWSTALKNIYDFYPEIKVVATGSSALEIYKSEPDLSRRASVYVLEEMSFREYLSLVHGLNFPPVSLDEILTNHQDYENAINRSIKPIRYFTEFLTNGAYPFVVEETVKFHEKLEAIINTVLENDIPTIENITFETTTKLKKLLLLLASSAPFKPNVSELSAKIGTSRDQLLKYLHLLERASLIKMLRHPGTGNTLLSKPEKIFLSNTNLFHALDVHPNTGSMRETFFHQQLRVKHKLAYAKHGDFIVDGTYTFEIGGPDKTAAQIAGIRHAYIAADGIEYGFKHKIPLWLFGFLY